jgi:uncharacterized damage-inducible protein DinB
MTRLQSAFQMMEGSIENIDRVVEDAPKQALTWKPSADGWTILQILGHLEEALHYWLKELQAARIDESVQWGRGLSDPDRLAAVENTGSRNTRETIQRLRHECSRISQAFQSMEDKDLDVERTSRNPKFGTKQLWFIVDHMMVEHLQKHCGQIQRNLEQYKEIT